MVDPLKSHEAGPGPGSTALHIHPGYSILFHARLGLTAAYLWTAATLPICAGALQGSDFRFWDHRFSTSSHRFIFLCRVGEARCAHRNRNRNRQGDGQRRCNKGTTTAASRQPPNPPPWTTTCSAITSTSAALSRKTPTTSRCSITRCANTPQLSPIGRHPVANSPASASRIPSTTPRKSTRCQTMNSTTFCTAGYVTSRPLTTHPCPLIKHSGKYRTDRRSLSIFQGVFAPPDRQRSGTQLLSGVRLM